MIQKRADPRGSIASSTIPVLCTPSDLPATNDRARDAIKLSQNGAKEDK
jgi:hypothetical protein